MGCVDWREFQTNNCGISFIFCATFVLARRQNKMAHSRVQNASVFTGPCKRVESGYFGGIEGKAVKRGCASYEGKLKN